MLTRKIDQFLGSRGFKPADPGSAGAAATPPPAVPSQPAAANQTPLNFVCEDDVRKAMREGRQLILAERAIVTPSARELAEQHRVFTAAPWMG